MNLATVFSRAQTGMEAPLVTVEVHLSNGLSGLSFARNINPKTCANDRRVNQLTSHT